MYTEYVFENKKYEVASREIKATLFDIVTTEEEKIAQLREKAFVDANDPRRAAELQNLYVQQDACLREILSISDKLTKSLQRVDACSRKLKQIEDKNVAQIIATIKEGNVSQIGMQPAQEVMMASQDYGQPVMVASEEVADSYSGAADVAMAPEPVDEPVMETPATPAEEPKEDFVHEIIDVDPNAAPAAPAEEPKEDVVHEMIDVEPKEESTDAPVITEANDVSGVEVPVVTATETPVITETTDASVSTDAPVITTTETPAVETSGETLVIPTVNAPEVATEPSAETTSGPLIIPTADTPAEPAVDATESTSGPLIIPTADTPAAPAAEEASVPVPEPPAEETDELATIPVITISSDGPLEAVGGGSLEETPVTNDGSVVGIPEMVPGATNDVVSSVPAPVTSVEMLVFKKRTAEPPKVIMISGKQATKLRQSLPTQEALLSAKGYFKSGATGDASLEQQLVSNGLLAPDVATKQAQIEQMMNQANELYAAGRVEEAQNMYNQISELNKELQLESAGNVR